VRAEGVPPSNKGMQLHAAQPSRCGLDSLGLGGVDFVPHTRRDR
jgi:hypothetical protein